MACQAGRQKHPYAFSWSRDLSAGDKSRREQGNQIKGAFMLPHPMCL